MYDWLYAKLIHPRVCPGVLRTQAATVDQGHGGLGSGVEGVTPLHLAAALPDGGRLAERILSEYQVSASGGACGLVVNTRPS